MTGGIGRATTVLNDYFRNCFGWKVYSIYAFEAKDDCVRAVNDGSIQLRLHDRLGMRRLAQNYVRATEFIRQNQIQIVIIQTSMDVVAKLRKALDRGNLQNVKIISVLHYSPGTDEFPISLSELKSNILQGKASAKNLLKGIVAPAYNTLEHFATIKAYQNAYKYGDAVILLSDSYISAYKEFAHLKDTNKLLAIPNCLPFEHTLTHEEIEAKDKTALVVGRMVDFPKRISLILKMWQTIEQHPVAKDWNLDIVGDGPDLETFKSLANKLGLLHCTFHGRKDPIDYYRLTLVEAQMMGCIPVSFDTFDSLKEVVTDKENGRIIPNNDTEKYVNTVIELMNSSDTRLKLVQNGLNNCQRYSQQTICNRWKSLIESFVVSRQ